MYSEEAGAPEELMLEEYINKMPKKVRTIAEKSKGKSNSKRFVFI
jgi:hypothetical protein